MNARLHHLIDDAHPAAAPLLASLVKLWHDAEHNIHTARRSHAVEAELHALGIQSQTLKNYPTQDAVIAWSPLLALRASFASRQPVAWVAFTVPPRWLLALLRFRGVRAFCVYRDIETHLRRAGLQTQRVDALAHDFPQTPTTQPRQSNDRLIALAADDPNRADVLAALLIASLAEEAARDMDQSPRLCLAVAPGVEQFTTARAMTDLAEKPYRLLVEPALLTPWRSLQHYDAVLVAGPHTALAHRWALASGKPTIEVRPGDPGPAARLLREQLDQPSLVPAAPADVAAWRVAIENGLQSPHLPDNPAHA